MKILVTGGAGFIGSHLVDLLVQHHEVVVMDNFSSGRPEWVNPRAKLVQGDVLDKGHIAKAILGCKAVFHLAAQTDVRKSIEDPDRDYEINFVGSKNVFDEAKFVGAKVAFTSSAAVYGDAPVPVSEEADTRPISQYGWNKLSAERVAPENAFIARLFNAYGPRGKGAVNSFCEAVKSGKEISIRGTGLQTRDFIYVGDIAEALLHGLSSKGTYNIGTGKEFTVLSALHVVESVVGKAAKVKNVPGIKGEIAHSRADATKAMRELGWRASTTLRQGIEKTAAVR
jgi:UDP-glucose 4-epimerase